MWFHSFILTQILCLVVLHSVLGHLADDGEKRERRRMVGLCLSEEESTGTTSLDQDLRNGQIKLWREEVFAEKNR